MRRLLVSTVAAAAVLASAPAALAQDAHAGHADHAAHQAATQSEDARLAAFFEQAFQERIALSPQTMTSLGIKRDYGRLDDATDAAADRGLALAEAQLARMKAEFDPATLSADSRMSMRLFASTPSPRRKCRPFMRISLVPPKLRSRATSLPSVAGNVNSDR